MSETYELSITRTIPASPETLFDAWLQPEVLARFMCPGEGMSCKDISVDARVGGSYSLTMVAGDKEIPHRGEYTVIDRHSKLAFTWISEPAGNDSVVTLTFVAVDGGTDVTLRHSGLPSKQSRDGHEGGWGAILDLLARAVA